MSAVKDSVSSQCLVPAEALCFQAPERAEELFHSSLGYHSPPWNNNGTHRPPLERAVTSLHGVLLPYAASQRGAWNPRKDHWRNLFKRLIWSGWLRATTLSRIACLKRLPLQWSTERDARGDVMWRMEGKGNRFGNSHSWHSSVPKSGWCVQLCDESSGHKTPKAIKPPSCLQLKSASFSLSLFLTLYTLSPHVDCQCQRQMKSLQEVAEVKSLQQVIDISVYMPIDTCTVCTVWLFVYMF